MAIKERAAIFRTEGELAGVGLKCDVPLDTIVNYVKTVADLDDLDSIWNALTEIGVPNDVKKRWLKLYALDVPKHKITDKLREKIESGQEIRRTPG